MTDRVNFEGTVVRVESDGFGVIRFDSMIGSTTHGIFSMATSDPGIPFDRLRPGMHVSGIAEIDDHDVAAVKSLQIEPVGVP